MSLTTQRGLNIFSRFGNWLKGLLKKKPRPPTGTGRVKIPWLSWEQYPKVTIGGQEYAKVGNRFYTRHAVERTYPSGLGTAVGGVKGRSVAPSYIEMF